MVLVEEIAGLCGREGSCRGYGGSSSEWWTECCGRKGLPWSAEPSPAQLYGAIPASCPLVGNGQSRPKECKVALCLDSPVGILKRMTTERDIPWHAEPASQACRAAMDKVRHQRLNHLQQCVVLSHCSLIMRQGWWTNELSGCVPCISRRRL